jgi:hypothetical protein
MQANVFNTLADQVTATLALPRKIVNFEDILAQRRRQSRDQQATAPSRPSRWTRAT